MSDIARDNLLQWYGHTLLSRLDNKANDAIIIVMQRVHVDDLVGHVIDQAAGISSTCPPSPKSIRSFHLVADGYITAK